MHGIAFMATIYKEITIDSPVAKVWDAVRDFDAVHERLVPGFVTDCRVDSDTTDKIRVVTYFNGNEVRERLIGIDEPAHRWAYAVIGGPAHHNASVHVFAAGPIDALMEQGAAVIKKTLERQRGAAA